MPSPQAERAAHAALAIDAEPRQRQPAAGPDLRHSATARPGAGGGRPGARRQPERCPEPRDPRRRADVVRRPAGGRHRPWRRRRGSIPGIGHADLGIVYYLLGRYGDAVGDARPAACRARRHPIGPPAMLAVLAASYAQLGDAGRSGTSARRAGDGRPVLRPRSASSACFGPRPIARTCATGSPRPASAADHPRRKRSWACLIDGKWHDRWYDTGSTGGRFVRSDCAVPQLGHRRRQPRSVRRGRLRGRARPLPSLRLAGLPLGAPDADLPQAQGAGGHDRRLGRALADGRARLDLRCRPGRHRRQAARRGLPARDLHPRRARTTPAG